MTDIEKQALAIYGTICATAQDRPASGNSVEQLMRALADWRSQNPGLHALRQAAPEIQLYFLDQSLEWLQAEARVDGNLQICSAVMEAIQLALTVAPKPLPSELVCHLLRGYQQGWASMVQVYFPFHQLISVLTREQVTEPMRVELRKLHLYFAPSPTGKIDARTEKIRHQIAGLMRREGEGQLDPGRGPWSQIVFDELQAKDEITRAGWEGLLGHCRSLEQTVPGARWNRTARELLSALGDAEATSTMLRWLALGPIPGQPSAARSPMEDSPYQKGVVWCLGLHNDREIAVAIADFGLACLRKIPKLGAVSQKVGFACVQALGAMDGSEAVAQLTRLRAKVKYSVARRLIEKSLQQAAERSGLTMDDLEDISVGRYGLNAQGEAEIPVGDSRAGLHLSGEGKVAVVWWNAQGERVKSAPTPIKKTFANEVHAVAARAKELEEACRAQRMRLEVSLAWPRTMPVAHWRKYFIEHPLLGYLGRGLIWVFSDGEGGERSGIWAGEEVRDSFGISLDLSATAKARLWHPLASEAAEIARWREFVYTAGIRQPFHQAFREFYEMTDEDRETKMYSNRFAGVLMRQHQFASLCRARGWDYRLVGANFDGGNVPTRKLPALNMHAEFYVDIPSDRDNSLRQSALGEQSGAGINIFVGSDQVRFYRDRKEIALGDVPAIVYSEVMRDVDLFSSVAAVGDDETWSDQGERGSGVLSEDFNLHEITAAMALRADILGRVLPHTPLAGRCQIKKSFLEVRGQLGSYRIALAWGGAAFLRESRFHMLKIPQNILDAVPLDLAAIPIDLDHRTQTILRRAWVLANDWKIDSPDLIRQLSPD